MLGSRVTLVAALCQNSAHLQVQKQLLQRQRWMLTEWTFVLAES